MWDIIWQVLAGITIGCIPAVFYATYGGGLNHLWYRRETEMSIEVTWEINTEPEEVQDVDLNGIVFSYELSPEELIAFRAAMKVQKDCFRPDTSWAFIVKVNAVRYEVDLQRNTVIRK